jgi:hypothetical protein
MKAKFSLLLLCIITANTAITQTLRYSLAQPGLGLTAYSLQQNNPLSFTGNQAALTQSKSSGIGVSGERRFLLGEISLYTLGAALPTRLGNFGILINYTGFKNFNENKIGLAYARKLGRLAAIGIQFNYYGYRIPAYGNASTINFEIGAMFQLTDKLNAGIHVYNPVAGKLGKNREEKLASSYKAGLGYDVSGNLLLAAEIIKEENKPVHVIAGLQYQFTKQFFAKAGFISGSTTAYAGAGIAWKHLRLDISSSYHPQLGLSPGILLIMNF